MSEREIGWRMEQWVWVLVMEGFRVDWPVTFLRQQPWGSEEKRQGQPYKFRAATWFPVLLGCRFALWVSDLELLVCWPQSSLEALPCRPTEQQAEQWGDASGMLRTVRVWMAEYPPAVICQPAWSEGPCWLRNGHVRHENMENVQQRFCLTRWALQRTLTCLRCRKWPLWEWRDTLKDHTTPAGQGLKWDAPHEVGLESSKSSRGEEKESSELWHNVIFLFFTMHPSPSVELLYTQQPHFSLFPWHRFCTLAKQKHSHSTEHDRHRFSFNCSFFMSFLHSKCYSSHPLPCLFIQLTSSEHQKFAAVRDSVVKCFSQQFSLQVPWK